MAFIDTVKKEGTSLARAGLKYGASGAATKLGKDVYKGLKTSGGYLKPLFGKTAEANYSPIVYSQPTKVSSSDYSQSSQPQSRVGSSNASIDTGSSSSDGSGGQKIATYNTTGNESESDLEMLRRINTDAINKNFGEESNRLDKLEGRARKAYGQSLSQAEAYYPEFQRLIGEQQTSTENQIGGLETNRKMESERALGQARQLLNDLNRRQYAQMSATGNYGSSVPEAFADQFGNKAYAAQNQIQTSRDTALNELSQKRVESKQYFDQKLFEGKQKYDTLLTNLRQSLNAQLDQIDQARSASSSAKRQANLEAWNNYVNNKFSLDQELRSYQNQMAGYYADQNSLEDTSAQPLNGANISNVQNSYSNDILGDIQNTATLYGNRDLNYSQNFTPIYTRRKLTPEEQDQFGATEGSALSNTWR